MAETSSNWQSISQRTDRGLTRYSGLRYPSPRGRADILRLAETGRFSRLRNLIGTENAEKTFFDAD